ncbi:HAD family hydrolase [Actinomyces viscosus]|uniref:HAD-IC family P-type ATPase n=1 Tax=Actinomyces viscosus TaxID=1656 RepID=UPI000F81C1B1|nr:HAD-IC family P-type ATPase [Actinomyces viscosus]TFH53880.1 HAD family hydrolase [Actinomyces viscosus]
MSTTNVPEAPVTGLSAAQVAERVSAGRTNEYRERTSRSVAQILRANVFTIFNAILGIALVLVLVLGHWADALFGFVLLLNTATGTLAEIRAKRALDRLAVLETPRAAVIRDGAEKEIAVGEVVIDDVVRLRGGQQVPADGEVIASDGLEIDESILTGESRPVRPESGDQVMSGTTVTAGTGLFRTTAVGGEAYAHRLAREARRYSLVVSELQAGTNRVLHWISWVIVPVALVLVWSQLRLSGSIAEAWSSGAWRQAVVAGIAGVVSMVPQGLVLLTSVNFATASLALARRNVLVQELPAVEVLARVDTLCLDKTGTITTGRIRLDEVQGADGDQASPEVLSALALLCTAGEANATADAIRDGLRDPGRLGEQGLQEALAPDGAGASAGVESVPFSSRRKWSAIRVGATATTWVLGAPEIVLAGADKEASERARRIAARGARVVALARSHSPWTISEGDEDPRLPEGLETAGIVILTEEIRPDAAETLAYFRQQGVDAKVISGDSPETVAAVARQAGVSAPDGGELVALDARTLPAGAASGQEEEADLERLADAVESANVLGRVTPEQKRALVRALRSRGHVVAMTGDGVNDALALKDADLGIAMGNGAPATKAVARLVLLKGEFSALPGVVAQGRRVMANTERIASLFLAKTIYASLIAVVVAVTAVAYPFLPRQLTVVSSLTIGIPAFVLALAPSSQRYREGFLGRVLSLCVPAGIMAGAVTLATYLWLTLTHAPRAQVTTATTLVLITCGLWLLTLTARPLTSWRLGLVALMGAIAVLGIVAPPVRAFFLLAWPTPGVWWVIALMAGVAVGGIELVHLIRRRIVRGRG